LILADASVWIDHLRNADTPEVATLRRLTAGGLLAIGDLTIHEVLRGIRDDLRFARVRRDLLKLPVYWMVSPDVAIRAAQHYRHLQRIGITVRSAIDCLIATYCIDGGHQLLHSDRDFDPFEEHLGLSVVR
jgi:hypothetical protein